MNCCIHRNRMGLNYCKEGSYKDKTVLSCMFVSLLCVGNSRPVCQSVSTGESFINSHTLCIAAFVNIITRLVYFHYKLSSFSSDLQTGNSWTTRNIWMLSVCSLAGVLWLTSSVLQGEKGDRGDTVQFTTSFLLLWSIFSAVNFTFLCLAPQGVRGRDGVDGRKGEPVSQ